MVRAVFAVIVVFRLNADDNIICPRSLAMKGNDPVDNQTDAVLPGQRLSVGTEYTAESQWLPRFQLALDLP